MTAAWMVRQGEGGLYAQEMIEAGYFGVDFIGDRDLTPHLNRGYDDFRPPVTALFHETNPGKTKLAAGQAVNSLWRAAEGIAEGDLIVAPKPDRKYQHGVVTGVYEYHPHTALPHRRRVEWRGSFSRDDLSEALATSTKYVGTLLDLSPHAAELAALTQLSEQVQPVAEVITSEVQEQLAFQMEKQLEEFLVHNWASTSLGREFDIYEEEGQPVGQQYLTDTGPMDILAISKDRSRLLVVELKRGRASDAVVGQIQRYMGYVQDALLEPGQNVEGVIIAQEDDLRIRRALSMARNIRFMKYRIEFHLEESE
jgi:restriction system protein